jgi:acyl dehydratase
MPENTPKEKHSEIKLFNTEDWMYEEFVVGQKDRSISRTISEGEAMLFNSLVMDLHPYVADERFAKEKGIFGKRLVSGAQVFSYGLGLMAHNNIHTFSYGYDKLRFIKPVFIGDTIYTIRTHLEKRPKYKEMGLVRVSYEVFKNDGELALYTEHIQTVKYRHPERWQDQVDKK